jgi:hydrogenase expression/formation protein HypE
MSSQSVAKSNWEGMTCPAPVGERDRIVLGHGSGGRLSHELVARVFRPAFDNAALNAGDDAAVIQLSAAMERPAPVGLAGGEDGPAGGRLAVSTDAHVVWPLFFPGGDIGRLAVCGTVNDVAMLGAAPHVLTAGFVLEEGLEVETLRRIVESMRAAAAEAGVSIVAGDTKVVQKGKCDGVYITTAGLGWIPAGRRLGGALAQPGDVVIVSGPVGDHGLAVLSARGELGFEVAVESDTAPLNGLVRAMLAASDGVHVLRDPTRGGLATTLNEIAQQSQVGIVLEEGQIPVRPAVAAACEILGFDPLYVANEGKLAAVVAAEDAGRVLRAMRATRYGEEAVVIGRVQARPGGRVLVHTALGSHRVVEMLAGEMLPRIC